MFIIGKFNNRIGEYFCKLCDGGTYSDVEETLECKTCKAGKYSLKGSSKCTPCPAGYYGSIDSEDSQTCEGKCDAGRYGEKGQINSNCSGSCASGSYSLKTTASTSSTCLLCDSGKVSQSYLYR